MFISTPVVATTPVIDGDKVYIDDDNVYLSAEPHTIIESTDVEFNLISKKFGGDIDVAFGINSSLMTPKNPRIWNGTAWVSLNKDVEVVYYDYQGYDKWFLLRNVNIQEDVLYKLKVNIGITFNTSGKYWFGVKRSQDPISNGYYLDPWWSSTWNHFRIITIDNTKIEHPLTNFPVLVRINSTISPYCDGGDSIRFVSPDNITEYYYSIENDTWNNSGVNYVWVNVSYLTSTNNTFLMYYNNSGASDNQNKANTWNGGYMMVQHFNEASGTRVDSSGSTWYNMSEMLAGIGDTVHTNSSIIDGAEVWDHSDDGIQTVGTMPASASSFTIEAWVKFANTSGGNVDYIYYVKTNNPAVFRDTTEKLQVYLGGVAKYSSTNTLASNSVWYYVVLVADASKIKTYLYVNTTKEGESSDSTSLNNGYSLYVGDNSAQTDTFTGILDEVRVSLVARNTSWLNLTYHLIANTSGIITFGSVYNFSGVAPPDAFFANTTSDTSIALNFTRDDTATHTHIRRSTSGYVDQFSGTEICNTTGNSWLDYNCSAYTLYYYSAYGFNATQGNWSSSSTRRMNHTGPLDPTGFGINVAGGGLNWTWTLGDRSDRTVIVRKNNSYPTSITDGTVVYNDTGTYYNYTLFTNAHFRFYAYNSTVDLYSNGTDEPWGGLIVYCFNEVNDTALTFNVFITNEAGTQTYEDTGCTGPHYINLDDMPLGDDILIQINATGYQSRIYYMDLETDNIYTLYAYLYNDTELYYIQVVESINTGYSIVDIPIADAYVIIDKYINDSYGYETISSLYTDDNGYINLYLIPGDLYKINLNKTGYYNSTNYWYPAPPNAYGQTEIKQFKMIKITTTIIEYLLDDYISFTGTRDNTTNIINLIFNDDLTNTTDWQLYLYRVGPNSTTPVLFTNWSGTNDSFDLSNTTWSNATYYLAILNFNHTNFGYHTISLTFYCYHTPITSSSTFNALFTLNYGYNPFGWTNTVFFLVIIGCIFSFERRNTYAILILIGLIMLFADVYIGLQTIWTVFIGGVFPVFLILMGILMLIRDRGRYI